MLDFTDEQKLAQQAIRSWCTQKLEPKVLAMEAGDESVYPLMRDLSATFGIAEMARSSFAKKSAASRPCCSPIWWDSRRMRRAPTRST